MLKNIGNTHTYTHLNSRGICFSLMIKVLSFITLLSFYTFNTFERFKSISFRGLFLSFDFFFHSFTNHSFIYDD